MGAVSHRTDILRALANDPAATPGERAAALQALAIHEARTAPPVAPAEPVAAVDADVLLLYADGFWTLTVAETIVGTWSGSGTIHQREPRGSDYESIRYHSSWPEPFDIGAEMDVPMQALLYFRDFVQRRRSPISVVITTSAGAWMFAPAYCSRVSFTPSMRRRDLFALEMEIVAERESEKFKAASRRALPAGKLALQAGGR